MEWPRNEIGHVMYVSRRSTLYASRSYQYCTLLLYSITVKGHAAVVLYVLCYAMICYAALEP